MPNVAPAKKTGTPKTENRKKTETASVRHARTIVDFLLSEKKENALRRGDRRIVTRAEVDAAYTATENMRDTLLKIEPKDFGLLLPGSTPENQLRVGDAVKCLTGQRTTRTTVNAWAKTQTL